MKTTTRFCLNSESKTVHLLKPVSGLGGRIVFTCHIPEVAHQYVKKARLAFMDTAYYILRTVQYRKVYLKTW